METTPCDSFLNNQSTMQDKKIMTPEVDEMSGMDNNNRIKTGENNNVQGTVSSAIDAFYADAIVLVTGGTGFLGKALVEKLLRSCSRVSTIFLLMRPKRGKSVEQRFKEMLENPVYDRLRYECPGALNKIVPVKGDVSAPNLGLSVEDRALLMRSVNIVFHSAATVRFDEPIKVAVNLNTRGTDRMIDLCKGMANLVCLVHVSTAYSNADLRDIQEMVYSTRIKPQTLMDMCENLDDDILDVLEKKLLGSHPNTYTLTKGLAEQVILTKGAGLPAVAIVRPSIVCASYKEPFPGWVDNVCGITGIMMEIGRGTIRSIVCNQKYVVDVVPVDYVVDTLLCSAWHVTSIRPERLTVSDACPLRIYNCTSGSLNPVKWEEFGALTKKYAIETPTKYVMWYPDVTFRTNKFIHKIVVATMHFFPAFVVDMILCLNGIKPRMVKVAQRTDRAAQTGEFFSVNEWYFHVQNMKDLVKCIQSSTIDGKPPPYNVDITTLNWDNYVQQYMLGIRQHILKDGPESLSKARSKLNKLYWIQRVAQAFTIYMVARMLAKISGR